MILLTEENAETYLKNQNWLLPQETPHIKLLTGGVSNQVLHIGLPQRTDGGFVLKQAREQLRVPDEWFSRLDRIWREVEVLRICDRLLQAKAPASRLTAQTPRILHEDRENFAFAMSAAPVEHEVWKQRLLRGEGTAHIAEQCGLLLGELHAGSWQDEQIKRQLDDRQIFDELRLEPYYRRVAQVMPSMKQALQGLIDEVWANRWAMVHADFSPKNLLVYQGGLLLVDFETGHYGDPAFDLGFFLSHLVLKTAYLAPKNWEADVIEIFWQSYQGRMELKVSAEIFSKLAERSLRNLGGCLLARLYGKSQIDYLTKDAQRQAVTELACQLLTERNEAWMSWSQRLSRLTEGLNSA